MSRVARAVRLAIVVAFDDLDAATWPGARTLLAHADSVAKHAEAADAAAADAAAADAAPAPRAEAGAEGTVGSTVAVQHVNVVAARRRLALSNLAEHACAIRQWVCTLAPPPANGQNGVMMVTSLDVIERLHNEVIMHAVRIVAAEFGGARAERGRAPDNRSMVCRSNDLRSAVVD